jgi:Na+-translocating ferredoxin:NAD+ oxidoreductase RnfC subunit
MSDPIEDNGVVGAGGAGFPTSVKLRSKVDTVIENGAECEPLLHKDKELLLHCADDMLKGLRIALERVGASRAVIGVKEKHQDVIQALKARLQPGVEVVPLCDSYPSGDEFILVFDVTGRIVPPGGLPLHVGVVVNNVETLVNVGRSRPVTRKYLTVAGAVRSPVTLSVPIGVSVGDVLKLAGGATAPEFETLVGGVMMARLAENLDEPITKTVGGLIVLPAGHPLIRRHRTDWRRSARIGRAACDQCSFCTELCPRYLLGHPIEPHKAMRGLGFAVEKDSFLAGSLYCCECNLCTLFACPEELDPKGVCVHDKEIARQRGLRWQGDSNALAAHPLARARRIPTGRLMARFGLTQFHNTGPLEEREFRPRRVVLSLRQHVGVPCRPAVRPGDQVRLGDLVASPPPGALGANLHASIDGRVRDTESAIVIEA